MQMNEDQMMTYIMLGRCYDMLALIADALGKGKEAIELIDAHGQGQLMMPIPHLNFEKNE